MKPLFLLISLLLSIQVEASKIKLGNANKEEILEAEHPLEPDAKAAILMQEGDAELTYNKNAGRFEVLLKVYKKIKIYDASATDLGSFSISYNKYYEQNVKSIKGFTYNMEGGKIVKKKLEKDNIFDEKVSKNIRNKKIAMPNVKKGSVIEINYEVVYPYDISIPKWYFQYDIPVNETKYRVETPEWFTYNRSASGSLGINQEKSTKNKTIVWTGGGSGSALGYTANITTFTASNTPSLQDEDFVPCMNNYRSAISFDIMQSQIPGGRLKNYTGSWRQISNELFDDSDLGKQITKKNKDVDAIAKSLIKDTKDATAEAIFNYVRDNFAWNEYFGVYADEGIKGLLKKKTGNAADINLMLTKMLISANLSAVPVATKDREDGFINIYYPSFRELNYLIVKYTKEDGSNLFLDATDKNMHFGYLPERALNMRGITIIKNGGESISISNPNIGTVKNIIKGSFNEDLEMVFDCTSKISGYSYTKSSDMETDADKAIEVLESKFENRFYDEFNIEKDHAQDLVVLKEKYTLEENSEIIGEKIYIDAFAGTFQPSNELTEEKRALPIFKDFLENRKTTLQITMPEGYTMESAPENMIIALPEEMGKFMYRVISSGDKIVITVSLEEKSDIINPQHYEALKEFSKMIAAKSQEKIVLAKT